MSPYTPPDPLASCPVCGEMPRRGPRENLLQSLGWLQFRSGVMQKSAHVVLGASRPWDPHPQILLSHDGVGHRTTTQKRGVAAAACHGSPHRPARGSPCRPSSPARRRRDCQADAEGFVHEACSRHTVELANDGEGHRDLDSPFTIHRAWKTFGLQPHRQRTFQLSTEGRSTRPAATPVQLSIRGDGGGLGMDGRRQEHQPRPDSQAEQGKQRNNINYTRAGWVQQCRMLRLKI